MNYKPEVKYDKDHDVMHIFLGSPINSYTNEDNSGIYVHKNEDTGLITEFTIMEYSKNRVKFICKYPEYEYLLEDYNICYIAKDKILKDPIIKYDINRDTVFIITNDIDFDYFQYNIDYESNSANIKSYFLYFSMNSACKKFVYFSISDYKNSKYSFKERFPAYSKLLNDWELKVGYDKLNNKEKTTIKKEQPIATEKILLDEMKQKDKKTNIKEFLLWFFNNLKPVDETDIIADHEIDSTSVSLNTYEHLIDFNEILKQLEHNYNFHEYKETNNNYQIKVYLSKPKTYHLNLVVEINIDYPSLKIYLISVDGNSLIEDDIKLLKCNHKDSNGHSTIFKESYNAYKCKKCGAKFTVDAMYYLCKGE